MYSWLFVNLAIMLASAVAFHFLSARSQKGVEPDPASLEDFTFATATEDRVVPRVYGSCRIFPNLIYYANLTYRRRRHDGQTIGHGYYLDMIWCLGQPLDQADKASLHGVRDEVDR